MHPIASILVVDDHEFYRKGLISALNDFTDVNVIDEASNGLDCLKVLKKTSVDIIIMDIRMPGMDGMETARKALKLKPFLKIIGITEFIEEINVQEIIKIGFAGFLSKDMNSDDLKHVLQNITKEQGFYSPALMNSVVEMRKNDANSKRITKRETEILHLVAKGLTNQQIADQLNVSIRTITNHRANMHKKVGVKNTVHLMSWCIKNKLIKNLN